MTTTPPAGTIVKIIGELATYMDKLYGDFSYKNEWEVLGDGETLPNGESSILIKNLHGFFDNQVMRMTKQELSELK